MGVPSAGKRSRDSSKARVDSASPGRKSACSFSVTSASRGSCEISTPASTIQASSVIHLPRGLLTKSVTRPSIGYLIPIRARTGNREPSAVVGSKGAP